MTYCVYLKNHSCSAEKCQIQVGRRAAEHAGMEFTKLTDGNWALVTGFSLGCKGDVLEMLNIK